LIGAAVIAATIGFVNITLGSAIVGGTRRVPVELATASNIDAAKAEYRRPVFIPFPKDRIMIQPRASRGLGSRLDVPGHDES
jgi:cytochrome c peroxidase